MALSASARRVGHLKAMMHFFNNCLAIKGRSLKAKTYRGFTKRICNLKFDFKNSLPDFKGKL